MTLHGTALWLHIVLAVLLVGGSAWTHVASVRLRRACLLYTSPSPRD